MALRRVVMTSTATLALAASAFAASEPPPDWVSESRALGQQLKGQLKQRLSTAMAERGPAHAIEVCQVAAPAIATELSEDSDAVVRRTALRVRNPANAPDAFERAALEEFAARLERGEAAADIELVAERIVDGVTERRYMKPIMTEPLCLTCHGSTLPPEIATAIDRAYPEDQATGFAAGDLRGALSVTWRAAESANGAER